LLCTFLILKYSYLTKVSFLITIITFFVLQQNKLPCSLFSASTITISFWFILIIYQVFFVVCSSFIHCTWSIEFDATRKSAPRPRCVLFLPYTCHVTLHFLPASIGFLTLLILNFLFLFALQASN